MKLKISNANGNTIVGICSNTRNSAVADKPRDAFRGHSRSRNMVPFDMLGMVSLLSYSNLVRRTHCF